MQFGQLPSTKSEMLSYIRQLSVVCIDLLGPRVCMEPKPGVDLSPIAASLNYIPSLFKYSLNIVL